MTCFIDKSTVREADAPQHHGGLIRHPLKLLKHNQQYTTEGSKGILN